MDTLIDRDLKWLELAADTALPFVGATAPNPPVGACLVKDGVFLASGAHQKAGSDHAEVNAYRNALRTYTADEIKEATLYVTLEPCNHKGKKPPCTDFILKQKPKRVVYAFADLNPHVKGGGAAKLAEKGIQVECAFPKDKVHPNTAFLKCSLLIAPFFYNVTSGKPYLVHKMAFRYENDHPTMIPEAGKTTFTHEESVHLAHLERKKSDAILTDRATVLADNPRFTVRLVEDHLDKKRLLVVLSQKSEVLPEAWVTRQKSFGFDVHLAHSIEEAIEFLAKKKCMRVLVECGPTVSHLLSERKICQETLSIYRGLNEDTSVRQPS